MNRHIPSEEPLRPVQGLPGFLRILFGVEDPLPDQGTQLGREAHDFFAQSWVDARDGLLARTTRLSIEPASLPAPRLFRWTIERPYKRCTDGGRVELANGPIRGTFHYRGDALVAPRDEPSILVRVDPEHAYFHPNIDRVTSLVCHSLREPLPLEALAIHAYGILSYQNMGLASPLCREAAEYFGQDPGAMDGLEPVEPLY